MNNIKFLLEKITRSGDNCGCSFPCQCYGKEWEDATMDGMKDLAHRALNLLEKEEQEMIESYESLLIGGDQEIDFAPVKNTVVKVFEKEAHKLLCFSDGLAEVLADNGCWIAGGAVTSVFTGKQINDVDVYFPSKEAFSNVMASIYDKDVDYKEAHICHITDKSILLQSDEQDVQFIVFKFFESVEDIFNSFDFTAVMGAFSLKDKTFHLHPDFMKHNAQRFLKFNKGTDYPLISMLRVDKYRERGYTISKQEMLKIGMAVANKNFDSWEKVIDEVGSMYGLNRNEIFDVSKPFSLDEAITQLDNLFIPKHYKNMEIPSDLFQLSKVMPTKLSKSVLEYVETTKDVLDYFRQPYFAWAENPKQYTEKEKLKSYGFTSASHDEF